MTALALALLTGAWAAGSAAPPPAGTLDARVIDVQRLDPPAAPPLSARPREAPPLDGDASPRPCSACRLADGTSGRIPIAELDIRTERLVDGVAVRATAAAPEARELLWKAMVARGELIESLRNGTVHDLCDACGLRSDALRSLRIAVRRIPEGVELVYTSTSADVVREIHAAARATQPFVTRF